MEGIYVKLFSLISSLTLPPSLPPSLPLRRTSSGRQLHRREVRTAHPPEKGSRIWR